MMFHINMSHSETFINKKAATVMSALCDFSHCQVSISISTILLADFFIFTVAESRQRDSLHTMRDTSVSKLPDGKVLMWQMYFPSSETSVLMMTREESMVGSLLLKRTCRDQDPNAVDRKRSRERVRKRVKES